MRLFAFAQFPNYLTIVRFFLTLAIVVCLFIPSATLYVVEFGNVIQLTSRISITVFTAGLLFVIASFSDWLDGFLARKYQLVSIFGQIWDPLVDKVLTSLVYLSLTVQNIIPFYLVFLLLIRDFVVDGYRLYLAKQQIVLPADWFGKTKTVLQMVSLLWVLFLFHDNSQTPAYQSTLWSFYVLQNGWVFLAVVASYLSLVNYLVKIAKMLAPTKKQPVAKPVSKKL